MFALLCGVLHNVHREECHSGLVWLDSLNIIWMAYSTPAWTKTLKCCFLPTATLWSRPPAQCHRDGGRTTSPSSNCLFTHHTPSARVYLIEGVAFCSFGHVSLAHNTGCRETVLKTFAPAKQWPRTKAKKQEHYVELQLPPTGMQVRLTGVSVAVSYVTVLCYCMGSPFYLDHSWHHTPLSVKVVWC